MSILLFHSIVLSLQKIARVFLYRMCVDYVCMNAEIIITEAEIINTPVHCVTVSLIITIYFHYASS